MATDRLKIYNGALLICGVRSIASLTVDEEARYLLDDVWNDGGVDHCLSEGQWRFAIRTQQIDYDASIQPDFGLRHGFPKSTDWLLTSAVCSDEYFRTPLLNYTDESGVLYADLDSIYVKFVSNDADYGGNLSLWPPAFTYYVKCYFASRIILQVSADESRHNDLLGAGAHRGALDKALLDARNRDAISEPTRFAAMNWWNRARRTRGRSNRWDGGNPNSLIG